MKALLKKCLLAGLLLPLTACAHYYPQHYGHYPNPGGYGYGGGHHVWQRNYYGHLPSQNYNHYNWRNNNFPNYRPQYQPAFPRWDHDDWGQRPQHHHEGWNNRDGNRHFQEGDHDRSDRNSWQHRQGPQSDYPRYPQQDNVRDHNNRGNRQGWENNKPGQSNHHRRDHDRD